jgi:hypothetical protein
LLPGNNGSQGRIADLAMLVFSLREKTARLFILAANFGKLALENPQKCENKETAYIE